MLFRWGVIFFFLLGSFFVYGEGDRREKQQGTFFDVSENRSLAGSKLGEDLQALVAGGLLSRRGNNLSLVQEVDSRMRESCPESYEKIDLNLRQYNSFSANDTSASEKYKAGLIGGIKVCAEELKTHYVALSGDFAKKINVAYNLTGDNLINDSSITSLNSELVDFVRNSWPPEGDLGSLRAKLLEYQDFEKRCIEWGAERFYSLFYGGGISHEFEDKGGKPQYKELAGYLRGSDDCFKKLKGFKDYMESETFNDFVSLPRRCLLALSLFTETDLKTGYLNLKIKTEYLKEGFLEIESLKAGMSLREKEREAAAEFPDVVNYCWAERQRAEDMCHCGLEDCSEAGDREMSLVERVHEGDRKLCGRADLESSLQACADRVETCAEGCNKRLVDFKTEYGRVFFVSDLDLKKSIHAKFNTACVAPMKAVHTNFQESMKKSPYRGVEGLADSVLSNVSDIGGVCKSPWKILAAEYEGLAQKCGTQTAEKEEGEKKSVAESAGSSSQVVASSNNVRGVGGWGEAPRSQEDEIRDMYERRNNPFGSIRDLSGEAIKGANPLGYQAELDKSGLSDLAAKYKESSNRSGGADKEGRAGVREEGARSLKESLAGPSSSTGGLSSRSLVSSLLDRTTATWNALKGVAKEKASTADKHIRDYLLQDTDRLMYRHGYRWPKGRKSVWDRSVKRGIAGLPEEIRSRVYKRYNKVFPMSREEFRKRMGLMKEHVDLFEVNDLLFYRYCYTTYGKEECDEENDPEAKGRTLESIISRYNELAESSLITPRESRKIEHERRKTAREKRGLTREEELARLNRSLEESEKRAKQVRRKMGLGF